MKHRYLHHLNQFALAGSFLATSSVLMAERPQSSFQDALDEVNARSPAHYDPIVTPIPEADSFDAISTIDLLRKLESWNPALRNQAAQALGERGEEARPALIEATQAKSGTVRAGATSALLQILWHELNNWEEVYPDANHWRKGKAKVMEDNSELEDIFIRLTRDPELEVRVAALKGIEAMRPQKPEAARAVLALCSDEDEHLAQKAMDALGKHFSVTSLQEGTVIAALKQAMRSPLPGGRGSVIKTIMTLDEQTQRKFIPEFLAHLDWQPRRDTMRARSGQVEALEVLTEMRVTELIERLPKLMGKRAPGGSLFPNALDSAIAFGKDAKVILPELKAILAELEEKGIKAKARPHAARDLESGTQKLRDTIKHLESL